MHIHNSLPTLPDRRGRGGLLRVAIVAFVALFGLTSAGVQAHTAQEAEAGQPLEIDGEQITRIVETEGSDGPLAVAGESGLYLQDDEAENGWTRTGDAPAAETIVVDADNPDMLLAGERAPCMIGGPEQTMQRSEDGGATWTDATGGEGVVPHVMWSDVGVALGSNCAGFVLSEDSGASWTEVEWTTLGMEVTSFATLNEPDTEDGAVIIFSLTGEGGYSYVHTLGLADLSAPDLSPELMDYGFLGDFTVTDEAVYLAATEGVWSSDDMGATWTRNAEGLEAVTAEEGALYGGGPGEVDFEAVGLYAIAAAPDDSTMLAVGSTDGVYVADEAEPVWSHVSGTTGEVEAVAFLDTDTLLYQTEDGVFVAPLP